MTAPLRFALVPVVPTLEMKRQARAGDLSYRYMLAASPGNDLLERIVRALNTHTVNLKNDGFDQASEDVETLLNELGGGHG